MSLLRPTAPATLFLVCIVSAVPALAQNQAKFSGTVTAADGTPVEKVTVRLLAKDDTATTVEAHTNSKGKFLIGLVRPGKYELYVVPPDDRVLLHVTGQGIDVDSGRALLWSLDQDVVNSQVPQLTFQSRNEVKLDLTIGGKSETVQARREAAVQKTQSDFEKAKQLIASGHHAEALQILEPMAEANPDDPAVSYLTAFGREGVERWDDALAAVDRTLRVDPRFSGAHLLRGRILEGKKATAEAEAEFKLEIEHNAAPKIVSESWIALAELYRDTGRTADAIATYERVASQDPVPREVLMQLAKLYSSKGERDKAAATLKRLEGSGGTSDDMLLNLAISAFNETKNAEARQYAAQLLEKGSSNPNLSTAHSILARIELSEGHSGAGIEHLEKALELDPQSKLAAENQEILATLKRK